MVGLEWRCCDNLCHLTSIIHSRALVISAASSGSSLFPSATPACRIFQWVRVWETWCSSAQLSLTLWSPPQACAPVPGLCVLYLTRKRHGGGRWPSLSGFPPRRAAVKLWCTAAEESCPEHALALSVCAHSDAGRARPSALPVLLIFLLLTSSTLTLMLILT